MFVMPTDLLAPELSNLTTRGVFRTPDIADEVERLSYALFAPAPALFVVWQETVDNVSAFIDACLKAGASRVVAIDVQGSNPEKFWLDRLSDKIGRVGQGAVIVLLGCLSSVVAERRKTLNADRDFWMNLGCLVLFVEPIAQEAELKNDYPDIFSIVRDEVKLYAPEPAGEPRFGEVEHVDDSGVVCWIEISETERVKVCFARPLLQHLHPKPGLEFVWTPAGKHLLPQQFAVRPLPSLSAEESDELRRLGKAFRQRVEQGRLLKDDEE
jgi:hypothetical protein